MANLKLLVAYDGGAYLGWQATKEGPSIEATLQQAIQQILQEPIDLQAASRTDVGVHAEGQVVNFTTHKPLPNLRKLQGGINALLPKDIAVRELVEAAPDFHATLSSRGKEYHYHLCYATVQMPHRRHLCWHYPHPLDQSAMRAVAKRLVGTHDFRAFCNQRESMHYPNFTRTLERLEIVEQPEQCLQFILVGNHFLYKMARNLVGTLVYVGCGKLSLAQVEELLRSGDRTQAGITAPAHGLFLYRVFF